MQKLLIIADHAGIVPQRQRLRDGYDIKRIGNLVTERGFAVRFIRYDDLDASPAAAADCDFVYYASSQRPAYKDYIENHLLRLQQMGKVLIPALEHFRAHENKAFQCLRLATTTLRTPRSAVVASREQGLLVAAQLGFPLVVKTSHGWGSAGVRLIRSRLGWRIYLRRHLAIGARAAQRFNQVVAQQYLAAARDWKVVFYGDQFAGLRRFARWYDFRASGSGCHRFEPIPTSVLELAIEVRDSLGLPWGSLDIVEHAGQPYLVEYQVVHFGTYTAEACPFHYCAGNGSFRRAVGSIDIDQATALELVRLMGAAGLRTDGPKGAGRRTRGRLR